MAQPSVSGIAQARLAGRIHSVRAKSGAAGKYFLSLLKLPAADPYSGPGTVEVRSAERLGALGDEVSILVSVTGYARTVRPKDADAQPYQTADNVLSFVGVA